MVEFTLWSFSKSVLLNFSSYCWWTPWRIQSVMLPASPHCLIAFPGYSLCSWEPLSLITSLNRCFQKLCTVFLAAHYAVLCYTNSCACPYSLNGIQQLLLPLPSLAQTFQHCLWCCRIKFVRSVFRPLSSVFGALHLCSLRLNYPYSSILQLVSSLSVVVVFL